MNPEFSVLLPVYRQEDPQYLDEALRSIEAQTLMPGEIVLVKDGPLTEALDAVIDRHNGRHVVRYTVVSLESPAGLGAALDEGLKHCTNEWVARMDSDDIALPDRFERQFRYLAEHPVVDILGGWICEFEEEPAVCTRERRVPQRHEEIVRFATYRNPMNHMTVLFRKSSVVDAGGYSPMNGFEDYYLWMRMLQGGKRFANLPVVLLKARAGRGMIERRQGWRYAMDEAALEKAAYRIGFWSKWDLTRNFFLRFLPRLLPLFIVERLYNQLRKT